jgi:hypothetical protein
MADPAFAQGSRRGEVILSYSPLTKAFSHYEILRGVPCRVQSTVRTAVLRILYVLYSLVILTQLQQL